jgi:putative flippase GtrA
MHRLLPFDDEFGWPMKLTLTYAFLALIATAANICVQELVILSYSGGFALILSVIAGTGVGLLVKYSLDKRYIFCFRARDKVQDGQTFMLYAMTGVATTLIFLGFEFGFHYVFATKAMRYLGAVIGLGIGYMSKYQLDKRYVFRTA